MSELTTKEAMLERAVAALEKIKTAMGDINPVGVVQAYAGSTTPDGWLLCDGSAVSRTDYADLYAVIGTTYGTGDGSTTFNVPDLTDKFIQGNATAGTEKTAGLPNITGAFSVGSSFDITTPNPTNNAFTPESAGSVYSTGSNIVSGYGRAKFDASRSSSIYGNSTTVQPPAVTMRYIIKY